MMFLFVKFELLKFLTNGKNLFAFLSKLRGQAQCPIKRASYKDMIL